MPEKVGEGKGRARELGVEAARSGIVYLMGRFASSAVTLLVLIYLARVLRPADFGIYGIIIAFYSLLGVGGNFGIGTALRKKMPEAKDGERLGALASTGYVIALGIALALSAVGVLASGTLAAGVYGLPSVTGALRLASVFVTFTVLLNLTMAALVGINKVFESSMVNAAYSLIQLVAVVALVGAGYGIMGAVEGLGISLVVSSAIGLYYLLGSVRFSMGGIRRDVANEMVQFSAPMVVSHIAVFGAANFAILLLGAYAAPALVGNYNAAFKLGKFFDVILISNGFILLPTFAKAFASEALSKRIGDIYNKSIHYTVILLAPLLIYIVCAAQPIIYLLFSSSYAYAPLYLAVISIGIALGVVGSYAGNLIISYGDTKRFMKYQVVTVLIQVALVGALTPAFGINGLLVGLFLVSPILTDLIYMRALDQQFHFKHAFEEVFRVVVPAVLLMVILYNVSALLRQGMAVLVVDAAAIAALYLPMVALFGGLNRKGIGFIKSVGEKYRVGPLINWYMDYAALFLRQEKGPA